MNSSGHGVSSYLMATTSPIAMGLPWAVIFSQPNLLLSFTYYSESSEMPAPQQSALPEAGFKSAVEGQCVCV